MKIILLWLALVLSATQLEAANRRVFTYFTANWCPGCRVMSPMVYSKDFQEYLKSKQMSFSIVDVTDTDSTDSGIAEEYKVTDIPAFVIVEVDNNGKSKELYRHAGVRAVPFLKQVINGLK